MNKFKYLSSVSVNPFITKLSMKSHEIPMYKKVLFVCAMEEEFNQLVQVLESRHLPYAKLWDKEANRYHLHFGLSSCGITVICDACFTGISYFNAPWLSYYIHLTEPTLVLGFGTCASLINDPKGTIIKSSNAYTIDLDLKAFGYKDGSLKKSTKSLDVRPYNNNLSDYGPVILSGSHFLSTGKEKTSILKRFPKAVAFDMETFMFKCVCDTEHVPYLSLKAVSDSGSSDDFEANLEEASFISAYYAIMLAEYGGPLK